MSAYVYYVLACSLKDLFCALQDTGWRWWRSFSCGMRILCSLSPEVLVELNCFCTWIMDYRRDLLNNGTTPCISLKYSMLFNNWRLLYFVTFFGEITNEVSLTHKYPCLNIWSLESSFSLICLRFISRFHCTFSCFCSFFNSIRSFKI